MAIGGAVESEALASEVEHGIALFAPTLDGKLNVNTATEEQWALLPGIGPATAKKLVEYRKKTPFQQTIHVMRVKGLGRKTFEAIKGYLSLQGETTLRIAGSGSTGANAHK